MHWSQDAAATTGAALAFYCAFSLAPLLIIVVTLAGWVTDAATAYGHLSRQLSALFGHGTAEILLQAMKASQQPEGAIATMVSVGTLLLGATTVFAALEDALDRIWGSQALVPSGLRGWARDCYRLDSSSQWAFCCWCRSACPLHWQRCAASSRGTSLRWSC
jgi:uncharacterized BrkB/YihY/UPF0761 family membrane protein